MFTLFRIFTKGRKKKKRKNFSFAIKIEKKKSDMGVQDLEVEFDLGPRHRFECHKLPFCERLRRDNVSMICSKNEKGGPGSLKVFMHGFESI